MWNLPLPSCSAAIAYDTCIRTIKDQSLKGKFDRAKPDIEKSDRIYRAAGQSTEFGTLDSSQFSLPDLSIREVADLYDQKMAAKRSPGRGIYDSIRVGSRGGKCPLCAHREVMTLDHYLPKSLYPALAVNPVNLIPSCADCNKMKSTSIDPILHPYFDNVENERWLKAEVLELAPAAVRFFVSCPKTWSLALKGRVRSHFSTFKLDVLYASQAARTLSGNSQLLAGLYGHGGAEVVKAHLEEAAKSWKEYSLNSWESALFSGLANNSWFCSGGFRLT